MEIRILLDQRDEKDSQAIDPLGEIILSDGQNLITEKDTYIDSWLDALKEGATKLTSQNDAQIDLIEEPNLLLFQRELKKIKISYKNMFIFVDSIQEILVAIQKASKNLDL